MQTSLTPQFFPPAFAANFGWAQGIQWIYLTAMRWYESVYAIILPIHLTEMLFPRRRNESWLNDLWPISSGFSLAWFFLIILAYLPAATLHRASPQIPITVGWVWVGLGLLTGTVRVWSSRADGRVPHSAGAAPDHRSGRRPGRSGPAAAIRPGGTKPARYRPRWPP